MRKYFSSYDIVDFSLAGALENNSGLVLNQEALDVVKTTCAMADRLIETGRYDLSTGITEEGGVRIALKDPDTKKEMRKFLIEYVLIPAKGKKTQAKN